MKIELHVAFNLIFWFKKLF